MKYVTKWFTEGSSVKIKQLKANLGIFMSWTCFFRKQTKTAGRQMSSSPTFPFYSHVSLTHISEDVFSPHPEFEPKMTLA